LATQHIRGYFYNEMLYINLRCTYLLTTLVVRFVTLTSENFAHL